MANVELKDPESQCRAFLELVEQDISGLSSQVGVVYGPDISETILQAISNLSKAGLASLQISE